MQLGLFDGPTQQRQDLVVVVPFRDIVERPVFDRLHAIRDIADGDYIAGSVRMLDALLVALCIGGGVVLVYTFYYRLTGGWF